MCVCVQTLVQRGILAVLPLRFRISNRSIGLTTDPPLGLKKQKLEGICPSTGQECDRSTTTCEDCIALGLRMSMNWDVRNNDTHICIPSSQPNCSQTALILPRRSVDFPHVSFPERFATDCKRDSVYIPTQKQCACRLDIAQLHVLCLFVFRATPQTNTIKIKF